MYHERNNSATAGNSNITINEPFSLSLGKAGSLSSQLLRKVCSNLPSGHGLLPFHKVWRRSWVLLFTSQCALAIWALVSSFLCNEENKNSHPRHCAMRWRSIEHPSVCISQGPSLWECRGGFLSPLLYLCWLLWYLEDAVTVAMRNITVLKIPKQDKDDGAQTRSLLNMNVIPNLEKDWRMRKPFEGTKC